MLSIFGLFLISETMAQPEFNLGVKGGFTASKLEFSDRWEYEAENNLSYHIGAFGRIGWGPLFLQPEAYFNSRGGDLKEIVDENPVGTLANFDFSTVDVPLLLGLKVLRRQNANLRLMGGPVFGFLTSGTVEGKPQFDSDFFRERFYGWQYGAGVDLWMVTLDIRVENSGNSVYRSGEFSTHNRLFLVTAGIKLF